MEICTQPQLGLVEEWSILPSPLNFSSGEKRRGNKETKEGPDSDGEKKPFIRPRILSLHVTNLLMV